MILKTPADQLVHLSGESVTCRVCAIVNGRKQQGFVLVLTLWVLVIVALAAGYFAERVERAVELAQQSRQNTDAMIGMAGARAEILYRLGTTSMSFYGLGLDNLAIKLDDRLYRSLGGTYLRLQDSRGLFNLNFFDDYRMQRFLGLLDIPAERRGHMIDTLRDFIDADKLHRLNGAEEEEYLARKLPPPSNRNLTTPWEAQHIIGWNNVPQLWQNGRLADLATTAPATGLNPNTAPAGILTTLPGITEEIAQAIITRRQISPLVHEMHLAEIAPTLAGQWGETILAFPGNAIRITQSAKGIPWSVQYSVTLTPNGDHGPWRIDYYSRTEAKRGYDTQTDIPELPPHPNTPPTPPPD